MSDADANANTVRSGEHVGADSPTSLSSQRASSAAPHSEETLYARQESPPRQPADAPAQTVLIVEDEEPIAEAIAYLVEEAGYEPLQASHGRQALDLAQGRQLALVITDLMMPHMDGAELIAALRRDASLDGHDAPPIILMTAAGPRRAESVGADAVVRKPFDLDELEALIHRLIRQRQTDTAGRDTPGSNSADKDHSGSDQR